MRPQGIKWSRRRLTRACTTATLLLDAGVDIRKVQDLLGHPGLALPASASPPC
jgi:hypothetical protein